MDKAEKETSDKLIRSALGEEMLVRDVMTMDVITVSKYESVLKVADILSEKNISGLPVMDRHNRVVGIITQADILSVLGLGRDHTFKDVLKSWLGEPLPRRRMGDVVGDIMTYPAIFIRPEATIAEAVRIMDDRKIRRLTVIDGKDKLLGILTRADILKAVLRKLK
jgi:CBS domain-containing protein